MGLPASIAASVPPIPTALATCRGANQIWTDYLGGHFRFSSCLVQKVIGALSVGAAAATVASIIAAYIAAPAAISAIIPALMGWSAASLGACAQNGTGVEGLLAGLICWAQ